MCQQHVCVINYYWLLPTLPIFSWLSKKQQLTYLYENGSCGRIARWKKMLVKWPGGAVVQCMTFCNVKYTNVIQQTSMGIILQNSGCFRKVNGCNFNSSYKRLWSDLVETTNRRCTINEWSSESCYKTHTWRTTQRTNIDQTPRWHHKTSWTLSMMPRNIIRRKTLTLGLGEIGDGTGKQ